MGTVVRTPYDDRVTTAPDLTAPIGIFDSGFGGLTVARAIVDQVPGEDIVYLGDTAHAPYGPRPIRKVREYALACLDSLVELGVKTLVIACNTASAVVLADARERYDVPLVEVIRPSARRAAHVSKSGRIGVLCTKATAKSAAYDDALAATGVVPTTAVCAPFVDFVEAGVTSGPELLDAARTCLRPVVAAGADTVILGCTHYPLLSGVISYVLGDDVTLVSSAMECADATYAVLAREGLLRTDQAQGKHRFLTTGNPDRFEAIGRRLLGDFLHGVEAADEAG